MISRIIFLTILLGSSFTLNATIIDFEGVVDDSGEILTMNYEEDGYKLTSSSSIGPVSGIIGAEASDLNTNGSAIFGWCSFCDELGNTISLERVDRGSFDFLSFDAANAFLGGGNGIVDITGFFSDGRILTASLNISNDWTTAFLNWTGLVQVDFQSPLFTLTPEVGPGLLFLPAIDNLVMASVPLPTSMALFGLGFILLSASRAKKSIINAKG
ncbi:PEP-CTERM sorting domain-containing protein [Alteromonas sp. ASW11-130]|uniref:PEP-CTERM sorting domain-containing protein n=1 Tax=Alteromonas sp. ASW11-130 TaxID=3015775 RepID=UPI0022422DBD|nr:PEP-CTERM sorting domain-containing protein [Alteromonas sp. ASW11-130]MCW8090690.1 PEP-CTERM sorting domain-containing protein [Alteromonas sp. ASW11-130]